MANHRRLLRRNAPGPTRISTRLNGLGIVILVIAAAIASGSPQAQAQPDATMRIESQIGAGGPVMMVVLEGWPMGSVNITVCGADARRASKDCDNKGAQLAVIQGAGTGAARLPALTPPSDCPCVVRAATANNGAVRTIPVVVPGRRVMTPSEMPPDPNSLPSSNGLEVSAVLEGGDSLADKLAPAFGAPADRTFVLIMKNIGAAPLENLNASARVGSDGANGAPLPLPAVGSLDIQESRTYRVPVTVPAFTFGTYAASGRVTGVATPVTFRAETRTRPTGLVVLVMAMVTCWVVFKLFRRRLRQDLARLPADHHAGPTDPATAPEVAKV